MTESADSPHPVRITVGARPVASSASAGPLTEADFLALRDAAAGRRPLRNAARTARRSAVSILAVGALGVPLLVFWPSWLGWLMALSIGTIGVIEYIGAGRMRRCEPGAAVFLARNQLAFMALIVAYCVLQMLTFSPVRAGSTLGSADLQNGLSDLPDLQDISRQVESLAAVATYGFCGLVIGLSVAFQGGLALYYLTRRRHLQTLARGTPEWIQRVFRELES